MNLNNIEGGGISCMDKLFKRQNIKLLKWVETFIELDETFLKETELQYL